MTTPESLPVRLGTHADGSGDRTAVVYVPDPRDLSSTVRLTYHQLDRDARRLASALGRLGYRSGDRLLLLHPPGLEFVRAFVACQLAGLVAVPAPTPDGQRHRGERLAGMVADCRAAAVLTASEARADVLAWRDRLGRESMACLCTDEIVVGEDPDNWRPPARSAQDVAFLQYTSGSTSSPGGW